MQLDHIMRWKEESLEVSATMSCFMCVCVCIKSRFRLLKWENWYMFSHYHFAINTNTDRMKMGGLQFYRRNKFWTTTMQKGSDWEREDLKKVKQGCKAIDKVTHQTPGGGGTFRQVLDQATENRKIRHKDWYEVNCLWSLISNQRWYAIFCECSVVLSSLRTVLYKLQACVNV